MNVSIEPEVPVETLVEWTTRFVRHPSEQTELMEADPAVVAFVRDCVWPLAEELGLAPRLDAMGNLIAELGPPSSDRTLMFMAYAMTHPAASMSEPFAGELLQRDGRAVIRGRGVSEQKAALAAALAAVAARHRRGPLERGLTFVVSTAGETGRHDAAAAIIEGLERPPTLGIVVLGTSSRISLGNKGRYDIEVVVRGKAAHSSMPWAGVNAIDGARQVLERAAAFDPGSSEHPALGKSTLTATAIESFPKATHTIQNEVRMTFDLRLLPGQDPEAMYAAVRESLQIPQPWTVEIGKGAFMYPCAVAQDSEQVRHIRAGFAAAGLPEPEYFHIHGALDAGYLQSCGCPATMLGPGDVDMWHSDEEVVPVDDLVGMANAYLGLIHSYLDEGTEAAT